MAAKTVTCVGAVVVRDDAILAVRQAAGHQLEGQWTFPWGKLESGESPSAAAVREVSEEAGVVAEIKGLIGVQELPEPWVGWNAFVYLCEHASGEPNADNNETDSAAYLTLDQLEELKSGFEPWSYWVSRRVLLGDITVIEPSASNPFFPSPGFL